jgi:glucosamine--fructose-6-phosphate aminotransferase (isomerizing)
MTITQATFFAELAGQPEALRRLASGYALPEGRARLAAVPATPPPLILGMGASFHSGLLAARRLRQHGQPSLAVESSEALYAETDLLQRASGVLYISQSGASGEIRPLLDRLPPGAHISALTNDDHSPLARRAQAVLPLLAGDELTVATKTFSNSLALLWLLTQRWTQAAGTPDFDALQRVADQLAQMLDEAPGLAERWLERLAGAQAFVMIGAGAQAITARHAAMVVMEWLKVPAVNASLGTFRHGPIEIAQPGLGVVVFAAPGPAYTSTCQLARELEDYGASVVLVEQGRTRRAADAMNGLEPLDDLLAPILDLLPLQIFVEALARERGVEPGFRHIEKVVTLF